MFLYLFKLYVLHMLHYFLRLRIQAEIFVIFLKLRYIFEI